MKGYTYSLLLFLLLPCWSFAQEVAPGGVPSPRLWYSSEVTTDGTIHWVNRLSSQFIEQQTGRAGQLLNFNPAFTFDQNYPALELPAEDLKPEKWTLFTTYQARDTFTEKSIWSYSRAGRTEGILTTHRMADLQRFEYLNFSEQPTDAPKVTTYLQHQTKEVAPSTGATTFLLAGKPHDQQLPINSFTGKIPEIILYERVLSPEERRRVESYLALKYGTMLAPELRMDYLNASGQTVFAPSKNNALVHRITGIGRDDLSGLNQKQSSSSYDPGLLTIGLGTIAIDNSRNPHQLSDQHFLIWADNNEPLDRSEKVLLQPTGLQRQWLVQTTGNWSQTPAVLQFDTHRLRSPAQADETYWLLVDRRARGDFSGIASVDYYPIDRLEENGQAVFQDIRWDTDGSGRDVFTLATGPELLVQAEVVAPQCFPAANGSLQLQAVGGRAPYRMQLRQDGRLLREWTGEAKQLWEVADLPPGQYELLLNDADRKSYRESFYFQSADAPEIPLAGNYQLAADQPLTLDAGVHGRPDLQYEWQLPDGQLSRSAGLTITEAGSYTIRVQAAGCTAVRQITVEPAPRGNFRRVQLFPNPSSDGHFRARIHLERSAGLQMTIYDPGGRLLLQREQTGHDFYHTGAQLSGKGSYLIRFRSQNDQITIPFIVQ